MFSFFKCLVEIVLIFVCRFCLVVVFSVVRLRLFSRVLCRFSLILDRCFLCFFFLLMGVILVGFVGCLCIKFCGFFGVLGWVVVVVVVCVVVGWVEGVGVVLDFLYFENMILICYLFVVVFEIFILWIDLVNFVIFLWSGFFGVDEVKGRLWLLFWVICLLLFGIIILIEMFNDFVMCLICVLLLRLVNFGVWFSIKCSLLNGRFLFWSVCLRCRMFWVYCIFSLVSVK